MSKSYREQVADLKLDNVASARICHNLQENLKKEERHFLSLRVRRIAAVALSAILFCAAAFPAVCYGFGLAGGENWVSYNGTVSNRDPQEYNPDGMHMGIVGGHKRYYRDGEEFTLTYRVSTGHEIADISCTGDGFEVLSVELIDFEKDTGYDWYEDGSMISWSSWTYQVTLRAEIVNGKENSPERSSKFNIIVTSDNGYRHGDTLWGYSSKNRIYVSRSSRDSAFENYIEHRYIFECTKEKILQEYWRNC